MKKDTVIKLIAFVISLCVLFSLFLTGCERSSSSSSGSNYVSSSSTRYISESEAISIAKNSSKVQNKIAEYWDLKFYYTPDWGTCKASKVSGKWEVVLKGNISGYTDDYKKDFIYDKSFKITVYVYEDGSVTPKYISMH